jgi:hypothetical protein
LSDDDLHLALYLCYELHYRGLAGVDVGWEWDPALLSFRAQLEAPSCIVWSRKAARPAAWNLAMCEVP